MPGVQFSRSIFVANNSRCISEMCRWFLVVIPRRSGTGAGPQCHSKNEQHIGEFLWKTIHRNPNSCVQNQSGEPFTSTICQLGVEWKDYTDRRIRSLDLSMSELSYHRWCVGSPRLNGIATNTTKQHRARCAAWVHRAFTWFVSPCVERQGRDQPSIRSSNPVCCGDPRLPTADLPISSRYSDFPRLLVVSKPQDVLAAI